MSLSAWNTTIEEEWGCGSLANWLFDCLGGILLISRSPMLYWPADCDAGAMLEPIQSIKLFLNNLLTYTNLVERKSRLHPLHIAVSLLRGCCKPLFGTFPYSSSAILKVIITITLISTGEPCLSLLQNPTRQCRSTNLRLSHILLVFH